jgi:uncharacterized protein YjiS (DUF1127 family)
MAYAPAARDLTAAHAPSLPRRAGARILSWLEAVMNASQPNRCRLEALRLEALSDAQLAEIGLSRDKIMSHAFRRYLYL